MSQPHHRQPRRFEREAPRHRCLEGRAPTRVKRVRHKRNALSTYMWRNFGLAVSFSIGLIGASIVLGIMGIRPGTYVEFVKPEDKPASPTPIQSATERLVAKHDCSYYQLPNNAIPRNAVVVDEEGIPSLVSFDEGLEVYEGTHPERLKAVCAR